MTTCDKMKEIIDEYKGKIFDNLYECADGIRIVFKDKSEIIIEVVEQHTKFKTYRRN